MKAKRIFTLISLLLLIPGLALGSQQDTQPDEGNKTLMEAVYEGDTASVKSLLAAGIDPDTFKNALSNAASAGHADIVRALIQTGFDINAEDEFGFKTHAKALISAVENDHTEVVKELLAAGLDVNAKNEESWTALMSAVRNNNIEVVKLLLSAGANVKMRTACESSPWYLALIHNSDIIIMESLHNASPEIDLSELLIHFVHMISPETVMALVAIGADVNATDENGRTALQIAASVGRTEIVELLESFRAVKKSWSSK